MEYSFAQAVSMGYDAIVIFGDPANYISSGFRSCKNTASALKMGVIRPLCWSKSCSPAHFPEKMAVPRQRCTEIDEAAAQQYDETLEPKSNAISPARKPFISSVNPFAG